MKKSHKDQELVAFWKHDQFPYRLHGTVEYFNENGSVYIKEYARSFYPIVIRPKVSRTEEYIQKLHSLRETKKTEEEALFNKFMNELDNLKKEYGFSVND